MGALGRWARRLWYIVNRRRFERDLEREMAAHRAILDDPSRFGNAVRLREQNADVWGWTWIDDLGRDLRYALRLLRRSPAFATAAVGTLTLGIGASTAIFSVAYGVSLRPLPYPNPDRLVRLYEAHVASGRLTHEVSLGTFDEWRRRSSTLESLALMEDVRVAHLAEAHEQPVISLAVTPSFFATLGVKPLLGPGFKAEDEYRKTRSDEVVLSYGAWQRLFGGRADVVGQSIAFWRDEDKWLVVGVMPQTFSFGPAVDLWRPEITPARLGPGARNLRQDDVIARVKPGITLDQVRAELDAISTQLTSEFPAANTGWTATVEPLHVAFVGDFGRATLFLLAAVAIVLLVAAVNVAGLLLARAVQRGRETAIREALGAAPWRILRLWVTEAALLGALGAGLGVLLAWIGVRALRTSAPPGIPRLEAIVIDGPVLAVASIGAIVAVVVTTIAPLASSRSIRRATADRQRARAALTLAQCAGAAALVVLAVMVTRSFVKLISMDLGWSDAHVLSVNVLPDARFTTLYDSIDWSDRVIAELRARPGIEDAAVTQQVPLSAFAYSDTFAAGRGAAAGDSRRLAGVIHNVTDAYFDVMQIRVLEGRAFNRDDRFQPRQFQRDAKNERGVAVVTASVGQTLWPGESPIGRVIWIPNIDNVAWREVIGVIDDIQFHAVGEVPALHVFVPWTQKPTYAPKLLVKGDGDVPSMATVHDALTAVAPGTRVDHVDALETLVGRATARPRFTSRTVGAFGLLALLLAAIGLYGTLSYIVGARTREIAIRLSLGAARSAVLPQVLGRGLAPVLAGAAVGIAIAAALARIFEAVLFQIEPLDVPSFLAGALLLLAAAVAASLGPAVRVLRVNPATALRAE